MPAVRRSFVVLSLAAFASAAFAQASRPARQPPELPGLERLQERIGSLDLTDEQKKQIESLKDEVAEQIRSVAPQLKNASPAERQKVVRDAVGDVREKFMSILTPQQRDKLKEGLTEQRLPAARRPLADIKGGKRDGETPLVARLRQALANLDLSADQKSETDKILDDADAQAKQIRATAAGDKKAARDKAMDLILATRQELADVLTPQQQAKLRDLQGQGGSGRQALPTTRRATPDAKADGTKANGTKADDANADAAQAAAMVEPAAAVTVGEAAPAFSLARTSGSKVDNKTYAGKPTVLVFGSLSSPSTRDRLPKLVALKDRYRSRANVLLVYTREAHASDGPWKVDRNADDKVDVATPKTMAERVALANLLRGRVPGDPDVLVDSLDDATLHAFGDKPEGAFVIGPYGTLVGVQTYADPSGLPRLIDEAMKGK